MTLAEFLRQLQDSGDLVFDSAEPLNLDSAAEADAIQQLLALDERRRLEMPGAAPRLRVEPALWAARVVFRACQFLVCREAPAARVEADLREPCPGQPGPEQTYSVDLVLRRLPDLIKRASHIAEADPLVEQLLALAWNWPLSSVGIALEISPGAAEPDLSPILADASLRQLYVDRILATGDDSRLHRPKIRAAVENALGAHPELAPWLIPAEA